MAYGIKYQFTFQAQNGDTFYIIVEKDGYSGSVIKRCLGGAPIFRRERNGHVCGSSLEFLAECTTDGEFSEFYTSNPKLFRVSLTSDSGTHFRGFISPELYSEPDIAPPYDVKVTATDGLGELRRYLYEAQGQQTIGNLLEYLLSFTGLATGFNSNNATLVGEQDENVPAADFFDSTYINLDHMAGKTCYDVLTMLLDSIHADLFQRITTGFSQWQTLRETDVENASQIVCNRSKTSAFYDTKVAATPFGSMRSFDWWPVGRLESEVKPACKRMAVKTDANYGEGLVNADMASDTGWTKSNATYNSTQQAYQINAQNGYIFQTLSFTEGVRKRLTLKIRMRQYKSSQSGTSTESTAKVTVSMYGRTTGTLRNLYLREDAVDGHLYWSDQSGSFSVDLPAPVYGETEEACTVFEVEVPLYSNGGRNFAIANSISVQIARDSSSYPLLVHSCSLTMAERIAGYEDLFTFSNGARDEAPDVNSLFLPAVQGYYSTPVEFMYGVPKIISSGSYVAINLFDPVGLDYAKSNGIVRLYKRGRLNVPSGAVVPFAFIDSDSDVYLIRSFEWDPLNCEMQVELLSLPAASVSIASQEVTEVAAAQGGSGSSGSSSGGGGGGGGIDAYTKEETDELIAASNLFEVQEYTSGKYEAVLKASVVENNVTKNLDAVSTPRVDTEEIDDTDSQMRITDGDGYVLAKFSHEGMQTTKVIAPDYKTDDINGFEVKEDSRPEVVISDPNGYVLERLRADGGFYGSVKERIIKRRNRPALSWIDDDFAVMDGSSIRTVYSKLHTWCLNHSLFLDFATGIQEGAALTYLLNWEKEGFRYLLHPDHDGWWTGAGGYVHDITKVRSSLVETIRFFRTQGLCSSGKILVWPGSSNSVDDNLPVVKKYCELAISVLQGGNPGIVNDRYQIHRIKIDEISASKTKTYYKNWISQCLLNNEWVILYTHLYDVDPSDTTDDTSNTFGNVMDIVSYADSLAGLRSTEEIWEERKLMYDF